MHRTENRSALVSTGKPKNHLSSWAVLLALATVACGSDAQSGQADGDGAYRPQSAVPDTVRPSGDAPEANRAWVVFSHDDGTADTVVAEIAASPEERQQGLMHRESLAQGAGMLFVFEDSQERSFWMANTYVPLDIAYMDEELTIVSILAMTPLDTNLYPSGAPAMYALEVNQGWFAAQGIEVGDRAEVIRGTRPGS